MTKKQKSLIGKLCKCNLDDDDNLYGLIGLDLGVGIILDVKKDKDAQDRIIDHYYVNWLQKEKYNYSFGLEQCDRIKVC